MARKKLVSRPLDKLKNRILGMTSIDPKLVLTNGLSVDMCNATQSNLQAAIDDHFLTAVLLDEKNAAVKVLEKQASMQAKKILLGVINDFGEDSANVSKVGGTRVSERAKPVSKAEKADKAEKKAARKKI